MASASTTPRDDWAPLAGLIMCLVLFGGMLAIIFVPEWRVTHSYVEGRCVVLDKRLVEFPGRKANDTYRPELLIRYTVAGREYRVWAYDAVHASTGLRGPNERILKEFTVGQEYPCWYDPADPSEVVLVRGYSWLSYGLLLGLVVSVFVTGRSLFRRISGARHVSEQIDGAETA